MSQTGRRLRQSTVYTTTPQSNTGDQDWINLHADTHKKKKKEEERVTESSSEQDLSIPSPHQDGHGEIGRGENSNLDFGDQRGPGGMVGGQQWLMAYLAGFYIDKQIIWDRGRDDAKHVGSSDDRNKMGHLRYSKIMKGSRKARLIPRD